MNKNYSIKEPLPEGKLDNSQLQSLIIDQISYKDQWVMAHSSVGIDCAQIEMEEGSIVISSDPITAAKDSVGRLAVDISCNDIASAGARPRWITLVMLMPYGTTATDVYQVMNQAASRAAKLKVEIIGGHTEITKAVNQPVLMTTAIGYKKPEFDSLDNVEHQPMADIVEKEPVLLVMTKVAGLEGTAIIAEECGSRLKDVLSEEEFQEALALYENTSVVEEGVLAAACGALVSHDVTEGGVLGAAWELCHGAGCGCEITEASIPVLEVTRKISKVFDIDPLKLISSGSLISAVKARDVDQYLVGLVRHGIAGSVIGRLTGGEMLLVKAAGKAEPLEMPEADHLYKAIKR